MSWRAAEEGGRGGATAELDVASESLQHSFATELRVVERDQGAETDKGLAARVPGKQVQHCRRCMQSGHNSRSCPHPVSGAAKRKKLANLSPLFDGVNRAHSIRAKMHNPLMLAERHGVQKKQIRQWVLEYLKHERTNHDEHIGCTFGKAESCVGTAELVETCCRRMPLAQLDEKKSNVLKIRHLQPSPLEDPACAELMRQHMGMFARVNICRGQLITEFVFKKWVFKKPKDGTMEQCYCVKVRCVRKKKTYYRYGIPDFNSHRGSNGLAHRCNHVCDPAMGNVELVQEEGDTSSPSSPKVFIAALRDIKRGEELVYNYSGSPGPLEECATCFCIACRREQQS